MNIPLPSSRSRLRWRWSYLDVFCAMIAPYLSLHLHNPDLLGDWRTSISFGLISAGISLVLLPAFRMGGSAASYIRPSELIAAAKASVGTVAILFAVSRALSWPADVPPRQYAILGIVLFCLLVAARLVAWWVASRKHRSPQHSSPARPDHILFLGATRLTESYIRLLHDLAPRDAVILGVLDSRERLGRPVAGVPVVGGYGDLESLVQEFAVHGVAITRVIATDGLLGADLLSSAEALCRQRGISFDTGSGRALAELCEDLVARQSDPHVAAPIRVSPYFKWKRLIDLTVAGTLFALLAPLLAVVSLIALIDVGAPILFWQRRLGRYGHGFRVLKIRTLRAPFDRGGRLLSDKERLSLVGKLLRRTRLDELPQLLNVLIGDMSLIGPRPLLPVDQPADPTLRLVVRPGIAGWAQVNGGTELTPAEKDALDTWYIRNASLALDMRIALLSVRAIVSPAEKRAHLGVQAASTLLP